MYQASMIPLVSIFWESWNTRLVQECQRQIEIVLEAFDGMADWPLAARRSREVVSKMYEASKRPLTRQTSPRLGPIGVDGTNMAGVNGPMTEGAEMQHMEMMGEDGMVMLDNQDIWDLDGMLWGNLPDGLDMPFDGMSPMEFEEGGYDGNYMMHQ